MLIKICYNQLNELFTFYGCRNMKYTHLIQKPFQEEKKEKKKRERNPYLRLLSDEELDVLEILAKKALKENEENHDHD